MSKKDKPGFHDKYAGRADHESAGWHPDHGPGAMQFWSHSAEINCTYCNVTIDIKFNPERHGEKCPNCGNEMIVKGREIIGP